MTQQNYWMHRITCGDNAGGYAQKLFNGSTDNSEVHYISIGWFDFSNDANVEAIRKGGTNAVDELLLKKNWRARHRYNLFRFVAGMKKGDIVIVPQGSNFAVCRIADDIVLTNESIDKGILASISNNEIAYDGQYLHNAKGKIIDMGFYRRVEIIENKVPRCYATQRLYSALKYRGTNRKLSMAIGEDIKEACEAYREKRPINLCAAFEEALAKTVLDVINKQLNDIRFENLVEAYFKTIGARIEKPAKNACATEKGDADRIAYFDTINVQIMIQAKKHNEKTDDWAVKQITTYAENFDKDEYDTQLWVISTCDQYSTKAIDLAEQEEVRLVTGLEFAKMLLKAGIKNLNV